jgi:D-alanyl-D-alanine carboxypeptidase (penicillin-binding protein 5/6)
MNNRAKRLLAAAVLLAVLGSACANTAFAQMADVPYAAAKSVCLLEAGTGKVIYANNAHTRLPMASTTKIMTAILALEFGRLDEIVRTADEAYGVEGSSMYLERNEELSLKDLLYGLMLPSGNDAAVAIAAHIGGSVENFIGMMNQKAKDMGLTNTNFVTPNGLHDPNHYTTAYDLAVIAAYALSNETFREICSTQYYRTETGNHTRTFKNTNKLLWNFFGANGVKTGFTTPAGRCLVFSAEQEGMNLVGVVLNSSDTYGSAASVLSFGFYNYSLKTLVTSGEVVAQVKVDKSDKNSLALLAAEDIIIPVKRADSERFVTHVTLNEDIGAPVAAGDVLGNLEVLDENGELLVKTELLAANDVDPANMGFYLDKLIKRWTA